MGELIFQGEGTFEMQLQRSPTAAAVGKIVVVTLLVFADGSPQSTAQVELILSLDDAQELKAVLDPAIKIASVRARKR
jgi:hypothetical protein